jgi:hypothetical protein
VQPVSQADQAKSKVAAMRNLADAVAQNDQTAVAGALEEFRNIPFDARSNKAEAGEILEIYSKRVQGKAKGDLAREIQLEKAPIQAAGKR